MIAAAFGFVFSILAACAIGAIRDAWRDQTSMARGGARLDAPAVGMNADGPRIAPGDRRNTSSRVTTTAASRRANRRGTGPASHDRHHHARLRA